MNRKDQDTGSTTLDVSLGDERNTPFNNLSCQRWPAIFWPGYTAGGGVSRIASSK
jgi:hypothetical protein